MKKYMAYATANGNSGIVTKDGALKWATTILGQGKLDKVYICEIIEVAERTEPSIKTSQFFVQLDEPAEVAKKVA